MVFQEHKKIRDIIRYVINLTYSQADITASGVRLVQDSKITKLLNEWAAITNNQEGCIIKKDKQIFVDVVALLKRMLPKEVFFVQSPYLKSEINYHFKEHTKINNTYFFFKPSPTLDERKRLKKQYDKSFAIKRDSYEYNRILDYSFFELNNNIAFEFAKRKFPALYITEFLYVREVVDNLFEYTLQLNTQPSFINEKVSICWNFSIIIYKNLINKLLDILESGQSFYNIFEKFYTTDRFRLNPDEYNQRYEDFPAKDNVNFPLHKTHITRIIPKFRLPKLPYSLKWEVDIRINLALPDEQILEYIKHVKKKSATILTVVDDKIFSNKVLSYNDIELLKKMDKNNRKRVDIRKVVADILFVYDSLQLGIAKNKIAIELNNYNIQREQKYFQQLTQSEQCDYFKIKNYEDKKEFLKLSMQEKLDLVEDRTYKSSMEDIVTAYTKLSKYWIDEENYKTLIDESINK